MSMCTPHLISDERELPDIVDDSIMMRGMHNASHLPWTQKLQLMYMTSGVGRCSSLHLVLLILQE